LKKQIQSFTKTIRNEAKREREELLGINKPVHSKSPSISTEDDELEKARLMSLISIRQDELKRNQEDVIMKEPPQVRSQASIDEEEELKRAMAISLEEDRQKNINIPNHIAPIHQSLESFLNLLNPTLSQSQLLEKRRREAIEQEKLEINRVEKISQDQEYEESLARDREKELEVKKRELDEKMKKQVEEKNKAEQLNKEQQRLKRLENIKATLPIEPTIKGKDVAQLKVRLPTGENFIRSFLRTERLSLVKDFIELQAHEKGIELSPDFSIIMLPNRSFQIDEYTKTLEELGLTSCALSVVNP